MTKRGGNRGEERKTYDKESEYQERQKETSELWSGKEILFSNSAPVNPFWSFCYVIAWFCTHLFSLGLSVPSAGTSITHTRSRITLDCRQTRSLQYTEVLWVESPRNISLHFTLIEGETSGDTETNRKRSQNPLFVLLHYRRRNTRTS